MRSLEDRSFRDLLEGKINASDYVQRLEERVKEGRAATATTLEISEILKSAPTVIRCKRTKISE